MKKTTGITLFEIIIAIALLGIIATSFIPVFSSQFMNIVRGSEITQDTFDNQGVFEEVVFEAKEKLKNSQSLSSVPGWSEKTIEVFGETVVMNSLVHTNASRNNKLTAVYLSKRLSEIEKRQIVSVQNVYIDVNNDASNLIADLSTSPSLIAKFDDNSSQTGFYTNLYRWYKTQPGVDINTVRYPEDYTLIAVSNTTQTLNNLLDNVGANCYVVLSVVPVDIHGYRGTAVRSSNVVYVKGQEWRVGSFPWVDKNNNYDYDLGDIDLVPDSVQNKLDARSPYPKPSEPSVNVDLTNGSLFVPMRIDNALSLEPGNDPIIVEGSERVEWLVERNVNLAKDIHVQNGSDVLVQSSYSSLGGSINLHPYVKIGLDGNPVITNNMVELLDEGVTLTSTGSVRFETINRGSINFYGFSNIIADEIEMLAKGVITSIRSRFEGNLITFDTTANLGLSGSRKITLTSTDFYSSNPNAVVNFKSNEPIEFKGGSWSTNQVLSIQDGTTIDFEKLGQRVNNLGVLNLNNTARVRFKTSMIEDLSNQLRIRVVKSDSSSISLIPHNYNRNVSYADAQVNIAFTGPNQWRAVGSGQTNIEFSSAIVSGEGEVSDLRYSFDGNNRIQINVNTTEETAPTKVRLEFNDQYAFNAISGIAFFTYSVDNLGNATLVIEDEVPVNKYVLSFDSNGGSSVDSIEKEYGSTLTPPPNPTRLGHTFSGWLPALPAFMPSGNLSVTAQWTPNSYQVVYDAQGGLPSESISTVTYGQAYGSVAQPLKAGYVFTGWFTQPTGGALVTPTDTYLATENTRLYAQWTLSSYSVSFNSNGGSAANPSVKSVTFGSPYGELPTVTRAGYTFAGWFTELTGGTLIQIDSLVSRTENHTLYARWNQNSITVTFDKNSNSANAPSFASKTVAVGQPYGALPTVTRPGRSFVGWYTQNNGGTEITATSIVTNSNNHTLYALWSNKIICTELHRQGLLDDSIYEADQQFGLMMSRKYPYVMKGYHFLAEPVVSMMRESNEFTLFVSKLVEPWAKEMAYQMGVVDKGSFLGLLLMIIGIVLCWLVGLIVSIDFVGFLFLVLIGLILTFRKGILNWFSSTILLNKSNNGTE